ncbi:MAG: hypothetical protein K8I65_16880, partial [Thermoanaerobaculia bacterium]|nr:hypothetical protein [Thermoanaerobaculia bacterium]
MSAPRTVLALDFGSSEPSAALARDGRVLAVESASRRAGEPAPEPLELTDRLLADAGLALAQVEGVVALRGPGSFTGLRIACATALGLEGTGLAATAVSTFEALALVAGEGERLEGRNGGGGQPGALQAQGRRAGDAQAGEG